MAKSGPLWGSGVKPPYITMLSSSSNPVLFSGQEDYTLDDKGRVTVPRNWRRAGAETETFHLVPDSHESCLRVMSPERFTRFGEEARLQPGMDDKKHRLFMRHFYANSTEVTTDKQGRISVPKEYCERLKLRGGIRLVGCGDLFELWNKEKLATSTEEEAPQYNHFADALGL